MTTTVAPRAVGRGEILALVGVTLVTLAIRVWLGVTDGGPTLYFDEAYYIENARAIAQLAPYSTAHYPPLYSLLLAPGTLADDWYPATMALSAAAGALTVPAAWFLARVVGLRHPIIAAIIAGALPSAFAYAGLMMSENLSTPLFLLALAVACRARPRDAWVLGLLVTCLALTKYLMGPASVVIALLFLVQARRAGGVSMLRLLVPLLIPAVVLVGAYFAYALGSGMTLFQTLGLRDPTATLARGASEGTALGLVLWITVYLGVLALPVLPVVLIALVYVTRRRSAGARLDRTQAGFALAMIVLVVGYLAIVVQHSYGASYNNPVPKLAWGRYLMHLTPALFVLGLLLLQVLAASRRAVRTGAAIAAVLVTLGLGVGLWGVLFQGWVFGMPAWNFRYPLTAADVFPFRSVPTLTLVLLATVGVALTLLVGRLRRVAVTVAGIGIAAVLAVTSFNYVSRSLPVDFYTANNANLNGSLPRKLFELLPEQPQAGSTVFVLADALGVGRPEWEVRFWDVPPDAVAFVKLADTGLELDDEQRTPSGSRQLLDDVAELPECRDATSCYLVTKRPLGIAGDVDDRWGQSVTLYRVTGP